MYNLKYIKRRYLGMSINLFAVALSTVAMFGVGAFWYMPLFGNLWGKIHDFNKLDKATQKEMQSKMAPYYVVQIIVTFITAAVLAKLIYLIPNYSPYHIAFMVWLGFVFPTQVSAMIFGGSKPEWVKHKIVIMAAEALLHLLIAAAIISWIQ